MTQNKNDSAMPRRRFLQLSAAGVAGAGTLGTTEGQAAAMPWSSSESKKARASSRSGRRHYNGVYTGEHLNRIAFPLGGIGAGMICLEGTGALSHFSLRNKPEVFNEPLVFAAISVKGKSAVRQARVLEGSVPDWKLFGAPGAGNGAAGTSFGLPRFAVASFQTRFPFATVKLSDSQVPLTVEITGWSPFEPGDLPEVVVRERLPVPVALLEHELPVEPRLRALQHQVLEEVAIVVRGHAPLLVVVLDHERALRPRAATLRHWSSMPQPRAPCYLDPS